MGRRRGEGPTWRLPAIIVGLIIVMGFTTIGDTLFDRIDLKRSMDIKADRTAALTLKMSIVNAEAGVRGYVISGRPRYLEPYRDALGVLTGMKQEVLHKLDVSAAGRLPFGPSDPPSATLVALRNSWAAAVQLVDENKREQAMADLVTPTAEAAWDRMRQDINSFVEERSSEADAWAAWANQVRTIIHVIDFASAGIAAAAMIYAFRRITGAISAGNDARRQTERLSSMTDVLQSATGQDDANEVLRATAAELLPGFSGALYIFNNSRDRLDLSTRWGPAVQDDAAYLSPTSCWALKRGKPHMNLLTEGALRCRHAPPDRVTLEVPMAARGELYGLLIIGATAADGVAALSAVQPIAHAIADAMSLSLSSMALREQLRSQALRDPLTGLYNRRFLEEILTRLCREAEQRKTPLAAIMVDLDHFKKLNDQHGHAAGDATLRDVSSVILSCLTGNADVACRYGGEELAILLPNCTMASAADKAEQIRSRIAELTGFNGLSVTASLGVATIPESSSGLNDLLPNADAALYQAKQHGRNRVALAATRNVMHGLSLVEA